MTSSRRLDYTAEARKDLRAILRYTRKVWGERQRDIYARLLTSAIEELTRYLFIGEERDDIPAEMRAKPVKQHVIFYRVDDQAVTIIRLLHAKMDTASRLG
ncbi:MAG: toxin ParE1/3/4 [Thermomicrobiales bacterium]|jgi:toxin ParE1/3/4|nr:toxin ParE1/3/4 [Thermomicrobiales bacterium]